MNSNRLYKMFGSKSRLSREDITNYGSASDESVKHSIEMQSSSGFESDAMEGWDQLSYDTGVMTNLDKKFKTSSNIGYYIIGTLVVAAGIASFFLFGNFEEEASTLAENDKPEVQITTLMENQEITLDESDLIIPEEIDEMIVAPEEKQVKASTFKTEFKERKKDNNEVSDLEIVVLPYKDLVVKIETPKLERKHDRAKEIYLHDLKLIDYSKYRSAPTVKAKQFKLSGTPADMEDENSEPTETVMQEVDIPYNQYIDKSVAIFARGNYKKALARFETITETYSDDLNANFYAGLCLFNLGEYGKAIESLRNCIYGPYSNFDQESQWMIAQSYDKQGLTIQANKYYKLIVEQGGFYRYQAAAKMK